MIDPKTSTMNTTIEQNVNTSESLVIDTFTAVIDDNNCQPGPNDLYDPKRDGYGRLRKSKYHRPKSARDVERKQRKATKKRNRK